MNDLGRDIRAGLLLGSLGLIGFATSAEAACTPTGFVRDAINLTAALINPPGKLSGDVNANGCNIGVYYSSGNHQVRNANIHGANYYGIVNNGANVDIQDSAVSNIGEKPFNGTQHGVAIYFAFGSNARGNIMNNSVWDYQKGGIVVNASASPVQISDNTVTGLGPVNFIAQNGIQVGYGAQANVLRNRVSGNSYTGPNFTSSGGILLVGGDCYGGDLTKNVQINGNTALANDFGVWLSNLDAVCNAPAIPTKNTVMNNAVVNNAVNNTTGNGATQGYQAGIADNGNQDTIQNNEICGPGYDPAASGPSAALFAIDVTFTNNPKVKNNTFCGDALIVSTALALARTQSHISKKRHFRAVR